MLRTHEEDEKNSVYFARVDIPVCLPLIKTSIGKKQ